MRTQENTAGGIGCTPLLAILLTVLFAGLKLTGHIAWSWWWVTSPIWIYAAWVVVVLGLIVGLIGGAILFFKKL